MLMLLVIQHCRPLSTRTSSSMASRSTVAASSWNPETHPGLAAGEGGRTYSRVFKVFLRLYWRPDGPLDGHHLNELS